MRKMFSEKQLKEMALSTIQNADSLELKSVNAEEITGDSIIENMEGYGASLTAISGYTIENVYTGVVKNGNKLTFVNAFNLTKTGEGSNYIAPFNFVVPSDVFNKLYETLIGSDTFLTCDVISVYKSFYQYKEVNALMRKGNDYLDILYVLPNDLEENTKYYFRYEVTFLLSEGLIS